MNQPEENVLVVKRSLLDQLGSFHGLNFEPRKYLDAILSRGNNFFFPRVQAEDDPTYKQIIPYVLLAFEKKVLYYVRGRFGSRRGVVESSITLHPRGIPHGPHPGTIMASKAATRTDELAVMVDTIRPLSLTRQALELDDPSYPFSWLD